jgi:hypothetical protein
VFYLLRNALRDAVLRLLNWRILRWSQTRVMAGPFRGMRYGDQAICSTLAPKLLGTYEQELAAVLVKIRALRPDVIVDIGAAEGYYAVGLLFADFTPTVVAFETTRVGRELIHQLAAMNAVNPSRLRIEGICTLAKLEDCLRPLTNPVVIMDVEGHEALLLDPLRIPCLAHAHILVEMHDCLLNGLTETLAERMASTHYVAKISSAPRTLADLACADPVVRVLPVRLRLLALSENRPGIMQWLWLTPKLSPSS